MKIAIVGGGPRGLSALENLYIAVGRSKASKAPNCTIFEESPWLGAGPVYSPDQPLTNWLNIPSRIIELEAREPLFIAGIQVPGFPSYHEWAAENESPLKCSSLRGPTSAADEYPARSNLGCYLTERFQSIAGALVAARYLEIVEGRAVRIEPNESSFSVHYMPESFEAPENSNSQEIHPTRVVPNFDEIVLTVGHQPVNYDSQVQDWLESLTGSVKAYHLFTKPYPVNLFANEPQLPNRNIAVRGFGLAMIDVMRALTVGRGGAFEITDQQTLAMVYTPSGREPSSIVPFSLDGLPLVPKPRDQIIDSWYDDEFLKEEPLLDRLQEIVRTGKGMMNALKGYAAENSAKIFKALKDKAIINFQTTNEIEELALKWLQSPDISHPLFENEDLVSDLIGKHAGMAAASEPVSLDYCIGQVWRKMHPTMYKAFSFAPLENEVMADLISLDERMKRYSFGPPLASMQQVLALHRAGILDLDMTKDPEISLDDSGWKIKNHSSSVVAEVMVDSVLAAPDIREVRAPLVENLLSDFSLKTVYEGLGVQTNSSALIETPSGVKPVAVLGRLAKGSLFGVDAILECFGDPPRIWAEDVAKRIVL